MGLPDRVAENEIRDAIERGDFADLPPHGRLALELIRERRLPRR